MARAHASGRSRAEGMSRWGVLDIDGELAAGAFDHRAVEQGLQAGAVGGGRHRQQTQLRAQASLQIQAEGQCQVGVQTALVHFVEDHAG